MAKVDKWLKEKNLEQIRLWASDKNNTIAHIAKLIGISASTFYNWLNNYPEIAESFEDGRKGVDEEAENAFFKLCTGFHEKVTKMHKVRRWKLDDKGKRVEEFEEFVPVEEDVYVPPNESALEFYLCNRMPEKYKVKNAALPAGKEDEGSSGVVLIPETEKQEEQAIEAEIVE